MALAVLLYSMLGKALPVKLPQRSAGKHLQNNLFSKIMFSVSPSEKGIAGSCLKQSLGFCWGSSTGHRVHESTDMLARCPSMPWEGGSTVAEMKVV